MSDAMTNREIEDVLTSIRRLVAQEGGRAGDSGKLILTAEQRISPDLAQELAATLSGTAPVVPADDTVGEITGAEVAGDSDATEAAPSLETRSAEASGDVAKAAQLGLPEPDFGKLEATIAELEAAVGGDGKSISASTEAVATQPKAVTTNGTSDSNVTELYGRLSFRHHSSDAPNGEASEVTADQNDVAEPDAAPSEQSEAPAELVGMAEELADAQIVHDPNDLPIGSAEGLAQPESIAAQDAQDDPVLDAPDVGDGTEETLIDEETLQALVAQMVRAELHGQLGERITIQVRKLVRAEIAKALDERKYL